MLMFNIFLLPLDFDLGEIHLTIYPIILQDEKEVILVDCGYPNFTEKIQEELEKLGLSLENITKIIITHSDHDHMGSLKEIK